ncbi:MAG: hypothetical protein LBD52_07460 [Prevotellaceae bacterium]|jgi:hypothetical protein|nr:hypothetical protein [Prevotellaceae bacterium]
MKIVTTDGRNLYVKRIGEPDKEQGTSIILCTDENNKKTTITPAEIALFLGSYTFPPPKEKK